MAERSGIEWTDATWSPTLGCTNVSAGCDNCYAISTVQTASRLLDGRTWDEFPAVSR